MTSTAATGRHSTAAFDPITLQILWSRLIAIVDETAATLVRTSFSTIVRESNDYACVLLDKDGNSLAQSNVSLPSFIGTLPITVRHLLAAFPIDTLQPGDVLITNDPWMGTGHLNDVNIAVPIFHRGKPIAFAASVAHSPDIGGRLRAPDNRELFEEGLRITPTKLYRAGEPNEDVVEFIRSNVRVPDEVMGDIRAQLAANEFAGRRLVGLVEEYDVGDVSALARTIQDQSEAVTRAGIATFPEGEYRSELVIDGFADPMVIKLKLTIRDQQILCDYAGTSPQQPNALNVVPNYTFSYTAFALKCVVAPDIPNNEGCFRPLQVTAPEGSLLNPRFPAAVGARASIGHYLPVPVFSALAELAPDRVRAASGSPIWASQLAGHDGRRQFAGLFFYNGGQGAGRGADGVSTLSFPSNISNTPLEVLEHLFPVEFLRKELAADSGGPGQWRGGLGQRLEYRITAPKPVTATWLSSRTVYPAAGLFGGHSGALASCTIGGKRIDPKHTRLVQPDDVVTIQTPGGGGYGDPRKRDRSALADDVEDGFVTPEAARTSYGAGAT